MSEGFKQVNPLADFLKQRLSSCPQYARLLARIRQHLSGHRALEMNALGLSDSAKSLILSGLLQDLGRPLFFVVADNHLASFYEQELSGISSLPILLYPASEISPYEQVLSSPDNTAAQMAVLFRLLQNATSPYLVLVPARALMQRVLDKETLLANTFNLAAGQEINRDTVATRLVDLGYTRESLVTLRGEFSIRGDIIDIYPSAFAPVRIELFGDQIESIRTFKIEDQRSTEPRDIAIIGPRFWVVLGDEQERTSLLKKIEASMENRAQQLSQETAETLRSVFEQDKLSFAASRYPESTEYYAPFVHDRFATLLDYLPEQSLFIFDEWESVMLSLNAYGEKLEKSYEEGLETGRLVPLPHPLHLDSIACQGQLKVCNRLFFSSLPALISNSDNQSGEITYDLENDMVLSQAAKDVYEFDCHPVEHFANQMKPVVEKIKIWQSDGVTVLINSEQPQRIIDLLREWDCIAVYIGINEGTNLAEAEPGNTVYVGRHGFLRGFVLNEVQLAIITDAELFGLKRKPAGYRRSISEKSHERFTSVADLKVGDFVVHIKHGIGQFTGVQRISMDNEQREYLTIQYSGDDRLYVPVDQINLLSRYRGAGEAAPRLSRLGGTEWETVKRRVKRSVKQVAEELVNLYAMRAKQQGFMSLPDTPWQYEMEEAFPFEETPDQWQAIVDTKKDMEASKPMDRLICGDVGFGKTEVAIRSIFKVIMSNKQAAVLVPTTILAQQHFNTLSERFAPYPIRIGLLSRFRTANEQKQLIERLAVGECDVVVGTHRMLQKDIRFKDLGLVIIDEEQRFGVTHKEKLKQLRVMVDVLTMSATPIPRTLHMALTGARDMSLINTPPTNRAPIKTFVGEYKLPLVRTAILHELERGGQIYFVHNRVESIEQIAADIRQLVPEARIAIGHGQMEERQLENIMLDFASHQYDIFVCTTIIESGLDIPNVNTIIINEADKLGLAQLYQLRGRVGRSNVQAYGYCLYQASGCLK